jgi:hypothetical protein
VRSGGEVAFICRVAGDSAAVITGVDVRSFVLRPHAARGASHIRDSREEMRALLRKLGFDSRATTPNVRSQEGTDEAETIVATEPSPDNAAAAAPWPAASIAWRRVFARFAFPRPFLESCSSWVQFTTPATRIVG